MPKFASESALTANLSEDEILAKLIALNAERAEEEKRGFVRWLRPGYERARAGAAREPAQVLSEEQLEVTAVVFAALMQASEPLDAGTIAKSFRQGRKVEPAISRVLASLARLGHVHTSDGRTFALRRSA